MKNYKKLSRYLCLFSVLVFLISIFTGCNRRYDSSPYYVMPTNPPRNQAFQSADSPPVMTWIDVRGTGRTFTLQIDYTGSGENLFEVGSIVGGTYYFLSEVDWEIIKSNTPMNDYGSQKVYWRIRVDDSVTSDPDTTYYSDWSYFRIISDQE